MPVSTWNIQFDYPSGITKDVLPELEGNQTDSLVVTPIVLGVRIKGRVVCIRRYTPNFATGRRNGCCISKNMTLETKKSCLTATASNGMQKVLYFNVTPAIVDKLTLTGTPVLSEPKDGVIEVSYVLNGLTEGAKGY